MPYVVSFKSLLETHSEDGVTVMHGDSFGGVKLVFVGRVWRWWVGWVVARWKASEEYEGGEGG